MTYVLGKIQQPDGDYVPMRANGSAFSTSGALTGYQEYTSDWFDSDGWNSIELFVGAQVPSSGRGIIIEYTDDTQAGSPTVRSRRYYELNKHDANQGYKAFNIPTNLDGFRVRYVNGEFAQSGFYLDATLRPNRSNQNYNAGGAINTANFLTEVALDRVANYQVNTKFGTNLSVAAAADIWTSGGQYSGFRPTASSGLALEALSTSSQDAGTTLSSGTATGPSSRRTLIDTAATFVSDGVAVGDIILNDDKADHGIITSVNDENSLTVFHMQEETRFDVGDNYRVVTAAGTGASVIKVTNILGSNWGRRKDIFIVLNGTNPVGNHTHTDVVRCSRGFIVHGGATESNVGDIVVRNLNTPTSTFIALPVAYGQSQVAATTVPKGKEFLIKRITIAVTKSGGSAASAVVALMVKNYGTKAWRVVRTYTLQSGQIIDSEELGGIRVEEGADIKVRALSATSAVSISAELEYLETDEEIDEY